MAALLYACGVFLAPVSLSEQPITTELIIIFIQFSILAFINLLVFSLFEKEVDQADGHISFINLIGVINAQMLIISLAIMIIISTLFCILYLPLKSPMVKVELLWLGMALTLFGIASKPSVFGRNEAYRVIGDSIFFYPLVMLVF